MVLAENASSCVDIPALASIIWSATLSAVCSMPEATWRSPTYTTPSSSRSFVPSLIERSSSPPTESTSGTCGGDEDLGAQVGEPAGDRGRRVDHAGDLGVDERVGRRAVEVQLVEHDDVTRTDPAQQLPGAAVDPGDPGDARQGFGVPREQPGELHVADGDKFARGTAHATP